MQGHLHTVGPHSVTNVDLYGAAPGSCIYTGLFTCSLLSTLFSLRIKEGWVAQRPRALEF